MGSDESHFNVRGKVTKTVHQPQLLKRVESRSGIELRGPSAYQAYYYYYYFCSPALPPGQTGSLENVENVHLSACSFDCSFSIYTHRRNLFASNLSISGLTHVGSLFNQWNAEKG